ncbi:hypothetical protein DPEC_G00068690 [Dallia pectoralis]|uniref:Uncharacterized protein n=1 Tax=Dallia pectoralis TaxID=75939 RepID=A0ACC2H1R0_DALPE|nr:hypothetical protein DPEC_G00068690 [Dallia pectoralis]
MANYLTRYIDPFDKLVAAIQANVSLQHDSELTDTIKRMLRRYMSDKRAKHPESLINMMWSYLTGDVAWNVLLCTLKRLNPDFKLSALEAHGLDRLLSRDRTWHPETSLGDALSNLSEVDLERVKLLLSWEIVEGQGHIPFGYVERLHVWDLAHLTNGPACDESVEQMDLLVELTAATGSNPKV